MRRIFALTAGALLAAGCGGTVIDTTTGSTGSGSSGSTSTSSTSASASSSSSGSSSTSSSSSSSSSSSGSGSTSASSSSGSSSTGGACTVIDNCADETCPTPTDPTCNACADGFYLSNNACVACATSCAPGEYETAACSATADLQCSSCTAISGCTAETCTTDSDQTCTACSAGDYLDNGSCVACSGACPAGEHESAACTASSDRACTACTVIPGCTAESCTTTTDQVCTACAGGSYLSGNACVACSTSCAPGEYESAACTATADHQCSSCTAIPGCTAETCTTGSDATCTACTPGDYLDNGICVACSGACPSGEYESAACTATTDRACSSCTAIAGCTAETCTTTSDQVCTACADGSYLSGNACVACSTSCAPGEFESTACSASADHQCSSCTPIPNCTAETCSTASDQTCTDCEPGFLNSNGTCIEAPTGGTITTIPGYRVHTFTADGNFSATSPVTIEYLIVAGGGGGGAGDGAGGGGGGVLTGTLSLPAGTYSVVIGSGGLGAVAVGDVANPAATNGEDSSFDGLVAVGGGLGGSEDNNGAGGPKNFGGDGGCGGGFGGANGNLVDGEGFPPGGAGITGQGYAGGTRYSVGTTRYFGMGGGGGAGGVGGNGDAANSGGAGGPGISSSISGTATFYGGGGGGSSRNACVRAPGGEGGGGAGGFSFGSCGTWNGGAGTPNLGGGGGGGGDQDTRGGAGGSGIVIIRYAVSSCGGGLDICADGCVDEQTDANNCGGCGVVCPSGVDGQAACVSGQCAAVQLAADDGELSSFHSVAIDPTGANVYWASDGDGTLHVYNVASGVDSVVTTFSTGIRPLDLAVDGAYVYISDENSDALLKILIASPHTVTTVSGGNGGEGYRVAVDASNLYWCSRPGGGGAPTISQFPTSGSNTPVTHLFTGGAGNIPRDLAIDSTSSASTVFWIDALAGSVNAAPVGVADGNVVLVSGETNVSAIATDGTNIYWATSVLFSGSSYQVAIKSAPIPSPLAAIPAAAINTLYTTNSASGSVTSLVVGGGMLYWSERDVTQSSVHAMLTFGGPVTTIGSSLGTVNGVALSPSSGDLFWTEGSLPGSGDGLYELVR